MTTEVAEVEEVEATEPMIEDLSVIEEEEVSSEVEEVVEEVVEEATDQPDENETEEETEGVEITLGDESLTSEEEEKAPDWVRELRKEYRETKKQNKELQKRLEEREVAKEQEPTPLGQKPKLEDFDFDTEKYENALGDWHTKKSKVDEAQAAQQAEIQRQQAEWQEKLNSYEVAKEKLGVPDYQDSEDLVMEHLSETQQGLILQGSDDPALTVYALGKNANRAKELASITDPVKFAFAVAKLESQLKVTKRKAKPAPETTVKGSSSKVGGVDSHLERLMADAEKTNDYTKVIRYERELEAKKKRK